MLLCTTFSKPRGLFVMSTLSLDEHWFRGTGRRVVS